MQSTNAIADGLILVFDLNAATLELLLLLLAAVMQSTNVITDGPILESDLNTAILVLLLPLPSCS